MIILNQKRGRKRRRRKKGQDHTNNKIVSIYQHLDISTNVFHKNNKSMMNFHTNAETNVRNHNFYFLIYLTLVEDLKIVIVNRFQNVFICSLIFPPVGQKDFPGIPFFGAFSLFSCHSQFIQFSIHTYMNNVKSILDSWHLTPQRNQAILTQQLLL